VTVQQLIEHPTKEELENALEWVRQSPRSSGRLEMIVARPGTGLRQVQEQGELDVEDGLVGDNWKQRGSRHTADGQALLNAQITLMNTRAAEAVAGERERWALAGDQLYVDLDISAENLPPGQRLAIGTAVLEITPQPHTGCAKFTERFGHEAIRWVNTPAGQQLRLRGVYARVVQAGVIEVGDTVDVMREA
jgi:MOSC domain-containing protein YiiM